MAIFEGCLTRNASFLLTSRPQNWTHFGPNLDPNWLQNRSKIKILSKKLRIFFVLFLERAPKSHFANVCHPVTLFWGRFWSKFEVKNRPKTDHFFKPAFSTILRQIFDDFLPFFEKVPDVRNEHRNTFKNTSRRTQNHQEAL